MLSFVSTKTARRVASGLLVVLLAAHLGGCRKPEFGIQVTQEEAKVEIDKNTERFDAVVVTITPQDEMDFEATIDHVTLSGKEPVEVKPAEGGARQARFRASSFPAGPQKLTVKVNVIMPGIRKRRVEVVRDVDLDRPQLAPRLTLGGCYGSDERLCVKDVDTDAKLVIQTTAVGPPGTRVELAGTTTTIGEDQKGKVSADVTQAVLDLKLWPPLTLPVKVTSPDGLAESKSVFVAFMPGMETALKEVTRGPVFFGKEPRAVGRARMVAWFDKKGKMNRVGTGRVQELELVAFEKELPGRERSCGTYQGTTSGVLRTVSNSARDSELSVYERKTGKLIKQHRVAAKMPACVESLEANYSGIFKEAEPRDIDAWLKTLLR